ncbi:alpha/beta hydrolase [Halomonas sp. M5N1S17]|uniref:esterase/lipase family protein n=1 Tax=Halomonas alkalisoli TaxID=2907158 RepID=UPI001F472F7F|nr:alpha/beta hydrolase [Halomonas alkalisoli]MCE9662954.1 alpha/beta hydrolase [Halomonas alkalisoli]
MDKYLPIIYVRGYAGSKGAVESTVDRPYYGFNLGSTQVRTGPDGDPNFFLFESPLVRMMKDHGYTDLFARVSERGEVELLNGEQKIYKAGGFPVRSLWIYRYYDRTSERAGDGTRDDIETLGENLGHLVDYVLEQTGAKRVHLVAHSMGGLICRSLIQRVFKKNAIRKIDRLFTYATPHRGIHFRRGLGFLTSVRDLLGLNDSDTFGPKRMRKFLGLPDDWDEQRLNEVGNHFPVERIFSLIGTNHTDYNLASLAVGPGSDGLVQMEHAYIKGSSRAFVYRSHSGPLGIVNSEEGYQNLQRFLFGDTSVRIDLEGVRLKESLRKDADLRFLLIETTVLIRGEEIVMSDQREEHGSALTIGARALESSRETLFQTYLMKANRPSAQDRYSNFQVRLRFLPHYVRNRQVLRDRHYFGEHLFQHTLTIGIRDRDDGDGRLLRAKWTGLDSDLPATARRYPNSENIRFRLPAENLEQGEVVLCIRNEEKALT